MSDEEKAMLLAECCTSIDDGLAPLVAAGIVRPALATVLWNSLRVGVLETSGAPLSNLVILHRTNGALHTLRRDPEDEIGGA